jgi:hypothetical protein
MYGTGAMHKASMKSLRALRGHDVVGTSCVMAPVARTDSRFASWLARVRQLQEHQEKAAKYVFVDNEQRS